MDSFSKKYYDEGSLEMSRFVPELHEKFRDQLCLKGRKIAYDDFTKFVKRGSSYSPLVCWNGEIGEKDRVIDLAPLINVGLAEYVTMMSHSHDHVDMSFLGWLQEMEFVQDWYSMLERAGEMIDLKVGECDISFSIAECLRTSLIDYRFTTVRRIYATLQALKWMNPKSYCFAVIEGLRLAFSIASVFMCPELSLNSPPELAHPAKMAYEQIVKTRLSRFGAVEYTVEGTDRVRRITDGRGLGISTATLFLIDLFKRFGDKRGVGEVVPYDKQSSREAVVNMFDACLGDDFIGRLVRNGRGSVMPCEDSLVMMGNEANFLAVDCHETYYVDGIKSGRGFKEGHILWKYAAGVEDFKLTGVLPPCDVTYGTRVDFVHACLDFAFSDRGMKMTSTALKKDEDAVIHAVMANMDVDAVVDSYKRELAMTAAKAISDANDIALARSIEIAGLNSALKAAGETIDEKQHIIDELSEEVRSLRSKVRSIYSDEDDVSDGAESGVAESSISTEEMLEFVNQFRLVVVGGFKEMPTKLQDAGFTNFFCLSSERASNNTLASGDFFCLCTKFLSHKLAYNVERHYCDQLDQFFYFNGTNVDIFLRTCYEFINGWFENGGGKDET